MVVINRNVIKTVIASVDWGFTNPGVILVWAIDGDGRMFMVCETYHTRKTIDWWIIRAKQVRDWFKIEMFVCDPAEPSYIQQFRAAGLPSMSANNEITSGIQAVQQKIRRQPDGKARIVIMRDALMEIDPFLVESKLPKCTAEELDAYSWGKPKEQRNADEKPIDANNHGLDALRYACHWRKPERRVGQIHLVNAQ